jgi:glutathione S-transferase
MRTTPEAVINSVALLVRGTRGCASKPSPRTPEKLLKLYDMEASPYCRLVREVLTELDLDALILPCPPGGTRFRPEAERLGGKQQFPLLVDENQGIVLYESTAIIEYLRVTYGERRPHSARGLRALEVGTSYLASALLWRPGGIAGLKACPSKLPAQPLVLYSFEGSPYSKRVRARMTELELPYELRNTGKGQLSDFGPPFVRDKLFKGPLGTTRHRRWLAEHTGKVQVPYLIDPNTGVAMYESQDILDYLDQHYAL